MNPDLHALGAQYVHHWGALLLVAVALGCAFWALFAVHFSSKPKPWGGVRFSSEWLVGAWFGVPGSHYQHHVDPFLQPGERRRVQRV